jgi:hypothetical protein
MTTVHRELFDRLGKEGGTHDTRYCYMGGAASQGDR